MKKIVYGVIVALCGLLIAPNVEAQAGMTGSVKEIVVQDEFYPIDVTDMPQILCDAVNTSYEGCMVKSVEVSNNSTFVKYKVVLVTKNGKIYKVYFDDRGHVVKEHAYFE
ncbi:hypothetical protein [Parabacteroides distasonis]|uniref:PepSY domain-containing protein n=1 Tax=Parabacteroides distasonis TaxID=823 RepID=A0A3L7ZP63_PARDI|nr:hypothetical protein [Parabacteroides distasonis]NBH87777.1 hypothetical protein [Parabacteroides distasonis]RLT73705.1 hypothetical protein D7V78_08800 [Parabacteroides distasonis]